MLRLCQFVRPYAQHTLIFRTVKSYWVSLDLVDRHGLNFRFHMNIYRLYTQIHFICSLFYLMSAAAWRGGGFVYRQTSIFLGISFFYFYLHYLCATQTHTHGTYRAHTQHTVTVHNIYSCGKIVFSFWCNIQIR